MGCDRISELPDSLLTQILLNLPTKDSVKTSVLSKRWELLWLKVLGIDLNVNDFPLNGLVFASFMEKFMEHNHTFMEYNDDISKMHKFKIKYNEFNNYNDRLGELLRTVVDRGIQHLDIEADMFPSIKDFMPIDIYNSETLVFLKLVRVGIVNPWFVVSLPCLKTMHLENNFYGTDGQLVLENLISGCPVLEDLTVVKSIDRYDEEFLMFLRVRSQSLKSFRLTFANDRGGTDFSVEIDAPQLEYMSFKDNQSDRIVVKNLSSLLMIDIDTEFNVEFGGSPLKPRSFRKRDTIRDFLTGISSVRYMIISRRTLEVLYRYSKLGPIPEFRNLDSLQAEFSSSLLHLLPVFLQSCPCLKNLTLDFTVSAQTNQIDLSYVPQCLSLTLEHAEIKGLIMEEETGKKLVKYILENSLCLKKLILRFVNSPAIVPGSDMSKQLVHTFTKCSRKWIRSSSIN